MSILSETQYNLPKYRSRLYCTDSIEAPSQDIEMNPVPWQSADKDFQALMFNSNFAVNPFYLHSKQENLTNLMRSTLIDWLFEISSDFLLKRETCHKAISIIDRFLSCSNVIKRDKFQLLGIAALVISCKFEEVTYPKITDFIKSAGNIYTVLELRNIERDILQCLQWNIAGPNVWTITDWLCSQWDIFLVHSLGKKKPEIMLKEMKGYKRYREIIQIVDVCVMDVESLKYDIKIIAACALYLVLFKSIQQGQSFPPGLYPGPEKSLQNFLGSFSVFLAGTLDIENFERLYDCGMFINQYLAIPADYDFPKVCKTGVKPEHHYQNFLSYQTYNPLNMQGVKIITQKL